MPRAWSVVAVSVVVVMCRGVRQQQCYVTGAMATCLTRAHHGGMAGAQRLHDLTEHILYGR
jgi:hypothetical protein